MKKNHAKYLLLIITFCAACKHDVTNYVSPDLKDWFNYKEGSYWVYQDSATYELDSNWVSSNRSTICRLNPHYEYESIDIAMLEKSSVAANATDGWHFTINSFKRYSCADSCYRTHSKNATYFFRSFFHISDSISI